MPTSKGFNHNCSSVYGGLGMTGEQSRRILVKLKLLHTSRPKGLVHIKLVANSFKGMERVLAIIFLGSYIEDKGLNVLNIVGSMLHLTEKRRNDVVNKLLTLATTKEMRISQLVESIVVNFRGVEKLCALAVSGSMLYMQHNFLRHIISE